jgi:putative ABC transport system substrate-binding protein
VRAVGAVYGPRAAGEVSAAEQAAARLGLRLTATRVASGPEAVRVLRALASHVDALWLLGDPDVVTPQVFQYALRLQLERGLPIAAATRQQVHSGALLAVDFNPRDAGRAAAELANHVLDGRASQEVELNGGARITVNSAVAGRLGADLLALERLGARLE